MRSFVTKAKRIHNSCLWMQILSRPIPYHIRKNILPWKLVTNGKKPSSLTLWHCPTSDPCRLWLGPLHWFPCFWSCCGYVIPNTIAREIFLVCKFDMILCNLKHFSFSNFHEISMRQCLNL